MKAIPRLLSCLLVSSVAMLSSGVAWSDAPAKTSQAQSPSSNKVKRARQARAHTKNVVKPKVAAVSAEPSQAKATVPEPPLTMTTRATVNPYLKTAAVVAKGGDENPYLPTPSVPTVTLAPSRSLTAPPAAAIPVVAPAPVVAEAVSPVVAKAVVATPAASPAKVDPLPAQPIAVEVASAQAWAKIVAGPAAVPVAKPYAPAPVSNPYLANPYMAYRTGLTQAGAPQVPAPVSPAVDTGRLISSLRDFLPEPHLPSADIDILPSITKVYPTGERPMYVLTFKCPTELVGITPPPTKALRWLITSGMEAINSTNVLPFSMQQVCQ